MSRDQDGYIMCDIRGCNAPAAVVKVRIDSLGRQTPKRGVLHLCDFHGDNQWEEQ